MSSAFSALSVSNLVMHAGKSLAEYAENAERCTLREVLAALSACTGDCDRKSTATPMSSAFSALSASNLVMHAGKSLAEYAENAERYTLLEVLTALSACTGGLQ
jgi:predicted phosphodiesterase